jgi:protein ImuB
MPLSAAWAIAPALRTLPRNLRAEQAALEGIAAWLGRFTPRVSLEEPFQAAAEVVGSLRLFGGLERLEQALRSGLDTLGFSVRLASAPTARAALWRAAGGGGLLENLRVEVTGADPDSLHLLRSLGIRTLGELMQLPRDGVARRLGHELLDALDQALGKAPEPRAWFVPPERFAARLELPAQVTEAEGLLFAARRLLAQLEGVLAARQSGIRAFTLSLRHSDRRLTRITLPLAHASRDEIHWTALLRERLARLELAAPVTAIRLEAGDFEPLHAATAGLFRDVSDLGEDWARLLERLTARLGESSVRGLAIRSGIARNSLRSRSRAIAVRWSRSWQRSRKRVRGRSAPRNAAPPRGRQFVLLAGRSGSSPAGGTGTKCGATISSRAPGLLVWIFRERERLDLHGIFA